MKISLSCLCMLLVLSSSQGRPYARVLKDYSFSDGLGNYEFGFAQSDNIFRWEKGEVRYFNNIPYIYVTGGYSYMDDDDQLFRVTNFVADQNGYQPEMSTGSGPGAPSRLLTGSG